MATYITPTTIVRVNGKNYGTAVSQTIQVASITGVESYTPAAQSSNLGAPTAQIPTTVACIITVSGDLFTVPTKIYVTNTATEVLALINA